MESELNEFKTFKNNGNTARNMENEIFTTQVQVALATLVCGIVILIYLTWPQLKLRYLHWKYSRVKFGEEAFHCMRRADPKLYPDSSQIDEIKEKLSDAEDKNTKWSVILNTGVKRAGKSFTASLQSLFIANYGCRFKVGERDDHCTIGIDISPPLECTGFNKRNQKCNGVIILDVEGFDEIKSDETNYNEILEIVKTWLPLCSVVIQTCSGGIDNSDKTVYEDLNNIIIKENKNTDIKYKLVVAPSRDVKNGKNWREIRKKNQNTQLHLVPLFDADSTVGEKVKTALQKLPYLNPTQFMETKHVKKYIDFSNDIKQSIGKKTCTPKQIIDAIDNTIRVAVESAVIDDGSTNSITNGIGMDGVEGNIDVEDTHNINSISNNNLINDQGNNHEDTKMSEI